MSFLKSAGLLFVVVFLSVLVVGCSAGGGIRIEVEETRQVPQEVSPDGGGVSTRTRRIFVEVDYCFNNACDDNEPDVDEVDDVIQFVRDSSFHLNQSNTESDVIGGVARLRGNGQERFFDVVRVGGQLRFASPEAVGLWVYDNQIHKGRLDVEFWVTTVGFESELVTASVRLAGRSVAATSFFVEIDCGDGDPFSTPDQACMIAP